LWGSAETGGCRPLKIGGGGVLRTALLKKKKNENVRQLGAKKATGGPGTRKNPIRQWGGGLKKRTRKGPPGRSDQNAEKRGENFLPTGSTAQKKIHGKDLGRREGEKGGHRRGDL